MRYSREAFSSVRVIFEKGLDHFSAISPNNSVAPTDMSETKSLADTVKIFFDSEVNWTSARFQLSCFNCVSETISRVPPIC